MSNLIKGAVFFSCFLPSFTRIGYASRSLFWKKKVWDFRGQKWIVTGATSGIGLEIVRQAHAAGAEVHAVGRSSVKLAELAEELGEGLVTHQADLAEMAEVSRVAAELADALPTTDVLVNNVGLMLSARAETSEGLEQSFATNVLGHYVLTEALRNAGTLDSGMVINMSSGGMYNVPMTLEKLQGEARFDGMLTYAYQKRAQVLLNSWWRKQGVTSYVMHPGWVHTPGVETAMPEFFQMTKAVLRDPAAGADTALWLAADKPSQVKQRGIWFDRGLRSDHYFADTQKGADEAELIAYLDSMLEAAAVAGEAQADAPSTQVA